MPVWPSSPTCLTRPSLRAAQLARLRWLSATARLTTPHTDHFRVPCASAGHVIVSLHNLAEHPVSSPLLINLPPFPVQDIDHVDGYLPSFLHRFPTATIHYRWASSAEDYRTSAVEGHDSSAEPESPGLLSLLTPLHWPTPIHDTLFAYGFLVQHLSPPPHNHTGSRLQRRPVYVYGSYLGASLASSLALTESHTHRPMAVRGLLTFNGIFNWTTLLPQHPSKELDTDSSDESERDVCFIKDLLQSHFGQPANLFDPFASPALFFRTAGMLVPTSFTDRSQGFMQDDDYVGDDEEDLFSQGSTPSTQGPYDEAYVYPDPEAPHTPTPHEDIKTDPEVGAGAEDTSTETSSPADSSTLPPTRPKTMRRAELIFPPLASSLKIPQTLLMHTTPPPLPGSHAPGPVQRRPPENSFGAQALGLAGLMRRSISLHELGERAKWDPEVAGLDTEPLKRVQVQDVGAGERPSGRFGLGPHGEEVAARWLGSRLG